MTKWEHFTNRSNMVDKKVRMKFCGHDGDEVSWGETEPFLVY